MKKRKSPKLKYTKETQEERKKRVSSGIKLRSSIFADKRRKLQDKAHKMDDEA